MEPKLPNDCFYSNFIQNVRTIGESKKKDAHLGDPSAYSQGCQKRKQMGGSAQKGAKAGTYASPCFSSYPERPQPAFIRVSRHGFSLSKVGSRRSNWKSRSRPTGSARLYWFYGPPPGRLRVPLADGETARAGDAWSLGDGSLGTWGVE